MAGSAGPLPGDRGREDGHRLDAIVIGAGIAGLYETYCLREAGFSVRCFEEGGGVGGTWYWNRYPGCAFDSPSEEYGFSFSEELLQEWEWMHDFSYQPDTERYVNFVADKLDLRPQIQFNARVTAAVWHEVGCFWEIELEGGERVQASFLVPALGGLSAPYTPQFEGMDRFEGEHFHTMHWPKEGPDFRGKRVAVIGAGPSAIQLIPEVAKACGHLTVFQRTANYAFPADNRPVDPEVQRGWKENYAAIHQRMRSNLVGIQAEPNPRSGREFSQEERLQMYEEAWNRRGYAKHVTLFWDLTVDREINAEYSEWMRGKIRAQVNDPAVAEKLAPTHPFGAKPAMLESGYYTTFNRENVLLVDLNETPIERLTAKGIETSDRGYEFDIIIYATGFEAKTGPVSRIDIRGIDGQTLAGKWEERGPLAYLEQTVVGFPNMFLGSPSALCATFTVCVEWFAQWIADCLQYMREHGYSRIEPTQEAEDAWVEHHDDVGRGTLFGEVESNWMDGSNIPGRTWRRPLSYARPGPMWWAEVTKRGYEGFEFREVPAQAPAAPAALAEPAGQHQ